LRATYRALEAFAAEAGHEIAFVERLRIESFGIARSGMAQTEGELVETPAGLRIRLRLRGIRMHDQVQAALEIVEHRDFFAEHEHGVGRAEAIRLGVHGE